jgi:hypothetical protein
MENKPLDQWIKKDVSGKLFYPDNYCKRCGRILIASNPRFDKLCNKCVAQDETI